MWQPSDLRARAALAVVLGLAAVSAAVADTLEPWLVLRGRSNGDRFGISVAGAGDVNGDGHPDCIVGADSDSSAGPYAGRACVYFGGPAADSIPDWILPGKQPGSLFGSSVAGAGDVNGDGFDDVIVGAIWYSEPAPDRFHLGRAYVFYGGAAPDTTPDLVFTGSDPDEWFGVAVRGAGDANGDGFADLIVGSMPASEVDVVGHARLYLGGPAADSQPDLDLGSGSLDDGFGTSVAWIGDVNQDNFDDFLVGLPTSPGNGRALLYFGGDPLDPDPDLELLAPTDEDAGFGRSVAGARDVNGDGAADFLVGDNGIDMGSPWPSRAYLFLGGPGLDAQADAVYTSGTVDDRFGTVTRGAGDVNGDGFADVLVGAPKHDLPASDAGAAYLYLGGAAPDTAAALALAGESAQELYGWSLDGVGDMDGDALGDFIVGCLPPRTLSPGRAFVYRGRRIPTPVLATLEAEPAADGVLLRWALRGDEPVVRLRLERSVASQPPATVATWDDPGTTASGTWVDTMPAGGRREYLLLATLRRGGDRVVARTAIGVPPATASPRTRLLANAPNPFNPGTTIRFELATAAAPVLSILDVGGRMLRIVRLPASPAGGGQWLWDGRDARGTPLPSGVYCVRIACGGVADSRRVQLLR